jgi:pyruvate dehydrogenase E2 component (dihydrolipoamide acetyltransferase)
MAFEITIPRLGWSMEEGIFAGWQKKEGEIVRPGDVLFELEGEKALQEVEALDGGILRLLPNGPTPGTVLNVGAIIGYLAAEGEEISTGTSVATTASADSRQAYSRQAGNSAATEATESPASVDHAATDFAASPTVRRLARQHDVSLSDVVGTGPHGRITDDDIERASATRSATRHSKETPIATPRAKRAAARMGVDWTTLSGSGRNGRVRERDVIAAATSSRGVIASQSAGQRIPVSGRRKVIADRLSESARKTVPVTITTRVDATNLMSLREQFKATGQKPVPAIHDIVAKLVASELSQFPMMAGRWDGDAIVLPDIQNTHVSLAVDTDDGLLVPVLRNVLSTPLVTLAEESSRLIRKAREGRLSLAEMQGGVFTISNLGSFGIDFFTPVINLPETAILGLGAIRREPVVANDGQITIRQMMCLSLTFDHRVIDGAPAAKFLQSLVAAIASPAARLLATA